MTGNDKKQIRRWIWFFLIHGGFIWFLYDWTHNRNEGALNLLMIVFWFFAVCRFLLVIFVSKKEQIDEENPRNRIPSILLLFYGGFAAYNGAVITGAVVIVSGLLYAAKCKLIREAK